MRLTPRLRCLGQGMNRRKIWPAARFFVYSFLARGSAAGRGTPLVGRHNSRETAPPGHKLRPRKSMTIVERRISKLYIAAVSAGHHKEMAPGITGRREAHNNRGTTIGRGNHLIQRATVAPGG